MAIIGMAEDRQPESRLADKDVTRHRLETGASGIAPALVIARYDDAHALPAQHHLRRTQDMTGRNQGDRNPVPLYGLAIIQRFAGTGEILAIARRHDRQGFGRRQHPAMAAAGMIAMAMGDDGAVYRRHR